MDAPVLLSQPMPSPASPDPNWPNLAPPFHALPWLPMRAAGKSRSSSVLLSQPLPRQACPDRASPSLASPSRALPGTYT